MEFKITSDFEEKQNNILAEVSLNCKVSGKICVVSFLDLIFPKKCLGCGRIGSYVCGDCFSKIELVNFPICPECERQAVSGKTHPGCLRRFGLDGLVVACRYKGVVRAAIQKIKYKWSYDVSSVLVDLLVENLWRFNFPQEAILIPVPLHLKRKRWRGFNQAEILAGELSKRFGQESLDLVERVVETKTQVGLTKEGRKKNVEGVFALRFTSFKKTPFNKVQGKQDKQGKLVLKGRDFILVDDVFTSGATMREVAKVLKRVGARSVWGMTVALG